MKCFQNILVATDTRLDKHPIVDHAIKLAERNGANLTIVDVVPEQSWIAKQVTHDLDHLHQLVRQEKLGKLEELASLARETDVDVKTRLLQGKASVEIVRQVLRGDHDLVISVTKGANSKSKSGFGRTARSLLQTCPCTVWLVAPNAPLKAKHVASCLDIANDDATNQELNDKAYKIGLSLAEQYDCEFSLLHAWKLEDEAMLRARLKAEQVDAYRDKQLEYRRKLMDKFVNSHGANMGNVCFLNGEVADVIPTFVSKQHVDLVVMGTVARSGLSGLLMGNTAAGILDRLSCSIVAMKPNRFKSPIQVEGA